MDKYNDILKEADNLGCLGAWVVPADKIIIANWVRLKCQYGCPYYRKTLCCPPYTPFLELTEKVLKEYSYAIIIKTDKSWLTRYSVSTLENFVFKKGYYKAFSFGSGPCMLCEVCSVGKPCVNPDKARPSMEGCGIDVVATLKVNNITDLKFNKEPLEFFGLILVE